MQTFEELYQKLNTEQQLAVDAIEGPVMVIAGPGTGKTQILATRILNILKKTDTQPQNILCLTYTEAGSTSMQKRLSQFMGPDAYKVPIYTFHGLCNKIIQDYPEKFSRRELRVMDELDKIDLVQGLIEKLPAQSILKSYNEDAQQIRKDLTKLWALMQSEEINASQINDWITFLSDQDNYKLAFPNHTYKVNRAPNMAGDLKMKDYDQAMTSWKKAKAAADLYENYKEAKAAAGLYEFSDMLEWVAKAFDTDEELLITYQEQFQYILVDEYQDTSGIQNHILYKLIDYWQDEPNCFVVGDDDQSVYAFQGAKVSNMLKFAEKYETHLKTVVLVKNYRSTQPILDSAKRLIDKNTLRLVNQMKGLSKDLVASGDNLKYPQLVPSNQLFNNEFHEAVGVAETIKKLIAEGETPNEIAVLFPQNKHALVLADAFNAVEVPFVIHRPVNILNETLIQHLINWLEYLSLELEMPNSGDHLIYKLLVSPLYDISSFEVNQMSVSIYADRSSSRKDGKEKYTWREHIQKIIKSPTQGDMFTNSPSEALKELWNNIEVWIKEASWLTVPELIRDIYSKGGYLAYALKSHDQEWTLEVLQTFMEFAIRMSEKTPFMKSHEFIATVKKMINNDITVPLEKRIGTAEGVQFITAHSSKGLEFEHVFVVRANQTEWEKSDTGRMPYRILSLIHGKSIQLKNATSDEESSEERRRLFYVAITRAKKTLHISYNQKRITATKVSDAIASTFVSEALESEAGECTTIPSERLIFTNQAMLLRTSKPKLKSDKMEWIASRTANFKFSPSTLYSILECGLKFYFTRIVRVPDAPSPAAAFGTAMHGAMHQWVDRWTKDKVWMSESDLKVQFDKEMYKERHAFNEKQFKLRMQQGHDVLPAYYLARKDEFKQYSLVQTERMINAVIDGVNISGFLDKMIFDGNRVTVVDYKTGKPENSAKKAAPPGPRSQGKLPNAYWFQLGIYQLMSNLQPGKSWQCNMALIDCIEKDEKGEFPLIKLHYDDDQNKLLREWIAKANHQLQTLEFMNGCGKAECYWCNFAKQTEQVILMPREADREEGNTSETD